MSDYNIDSINSRFFCILRRLQEDYEDEIVAVSLMKYHYIAKDNGDEDLMYAIDRVLQEYMTGADFNAWMLTVKNKTSK